MPDYTFFVLDFDGYLVGGTAADYPDDAAALARGRELPGTFNAEVELWQGSRRVAYQGEPHGVAHATRQRGGYQ